MAYKEKLKDYDRPDMKGVKKPTLSEFFHNSLCHTKLSLDVILRYYGDRSIILTLSF